MLCIVPSVVVHALGPKITLRQLTTCNQNAARGREYSFSLSPSFTTMPFNLPECDDGIANRPAYYKGREGVKSDFRDIGDAIGQPHIG